VSDYQPRPRGGWPAQPPADRAGRGYEQPRPGQPGHRAPRYGHDEARRPDRDQTEYLPSGYQQAGYQQAPDDGAPNYDAPAPGRRRRKRRRGRRWLIALAVVIVLLLAVLGIGDHVGRSYAQSRVATQIETSSGLSAKPQVTIEGWPFLTQILARDLKTVDISASNVTADRGKLVFSFTAKATGVHLNSSYTGATVDRINGQALLPFSSVDNLLPSGLTALSADPADGPDAVKAQLADAVSVNGTVKQSGPNDIVVQLDSVGGVSTLPSGLNNNEITIVIPKLPGGLVVQSVSVTSQGLVATASASNTTLSE
jgi:hypothetical protein